jgi:hypothetical protein
LGKDGAVICCFIPKKGRGSWTDYTNKATLKGFRDDRAHCRVAVAYEK